MNTVFWSAKAGSGCSVTAAALALRMSKQFKTHLIDLGGDQSAILGLAHTPSQGAADWFAAGREAPPDALAEFAVGVTPRMALIPYGKTQSLRGNPVDAELARNFYSALTDLKSELIIDVGTPDTAIKRAVSELGDVRVLVLRNCYLHVRRAADHPLLARTAGFIVVRELGRQLDTKTISGALGIPLLGEVLAHSRIAQVVDSGTLVRRQPKFLATSADAILRTLSSKEVAA